MAHRTVGNFDPRDISIGHRLQVARELHRQTQADLVKPTETSKNHISAVERGCCKASIRLLEGYCKALNCTPNEILQYGDKTIIPELKARLEEMDAETQERALDLIKAARLR